MRPTTWPRLTLLAFALAASACTYAQSSAPDPAAEERKAYTECAVQRAFSVTLPELAKASLLARAAMRACESERHAIYARLINHHAGLPREQAEARAAEYIEEVDSALADRLALHLRQAALRSGQLATSGASI